MSSSQVFCSKSYIYLLEYMLIPYAIHFIITDLRSCIDKKGVVSAEVFLLEDNLQTTEWKVYLTTHVRSKVGIPNFTTQYDFAQ